MSTIHVLTPTLTYGYKPICDYYNANKPTDWTSLTKLDCYERGFTVDLTPEELKQSLEWRKNIGGLFDDNDTIRQLRWTGNGFLKNQGYIGFTEEQTRLLFQALKESLGDDQVIMV
jgi:hypothetical protein